MVLFIQNSWKAKDAFAQPPLSPSYPEQGSETGTHMTTADVLSKAVCGHPLSAAGNDRELESGGTFRSSKAPYSENNCHELSAEGRFRRDAGLLASDWHDERRPSATVSQLPVCYADTYGTQNRLLRLLLQSRLIERLSL